MSDKRSRSYRKRKRALAEEHTRRRITEAAVELHGSVGPANTTLTEVARSAGVSRMTVYNHFPTEVDLLTACSGHWMARNPAPDPTLWAELEDPAERLTHALKHLYGWYEAKRGMMGNVFRDVPLVPALGQVMGEMWGAYEDQVVQGLLRGWSAENVTRDDLEALVRLVLSFHTWRLLDERGSDPQHAAVLASRMVSEAT